MPSFYQMRSSSGSLGAVDLARVYWGDVSMFASIAVSLHTAVIFTAGKRRQRFVLKQKVATLPATSVGYANVSVQSSSA